MAMSTPKTTWLAYALASGACAALNGVFAKLTTTHLTSAWAESLSHVFGLSEPSKFFEFLVRGFFFLLNLLFNFIMWTLFTRALTLASSTVRVSIMNTSANFMITAVLGALIFSESLPGLWWAGAAMLVAGSVIIGRREEGVKGAERKEGLEGGEQGEPFADEPGAPLAGSAAAPAIADEDAGAAGYRDSVELTGTYVDGVGKEGRLGGR